MASLLPGTFIMCISGLIWWVYGKWVLVLAELAKKKREGGRLSRRNETIFTALLSHHNGNLIFIIELLLECWSISQVRLHTMHTSRPAVLNLSLACAVAAVPWWHQWPPFARSLFLQVSHSPPLWSLSIDPLWILLHQCQSCYCPGPDPCLAFNQVFTSYLRLLLLTLLLSSVEENVTTYLRLCHLQTEIHCWHFGSTEIPRLGHQNFVPSMWPRLVERQTQLLCLFKKDASDKSEGSVFGT